MTEVHILQGVLTNYQRHAHKDMLGCENHAGYQVKQLSWGQVVNRIPTIPFACVWNKQMCGTYYGYRTSTNYVISCRHNQEKGPDIALTSSPVVTAKAEIKWDFCHANNNCLNRPQTIFIHLVKAHLHLNDWVCFRHTTYGITLNVKVEVSRKRSFFTC